MRWVILGLALLGALLAGGIGAKWLGDADDNAATIKKLQEYQQGLQSKGSNTAALDKQMSGLNNVIRAAYLLVIGCLASIGAAVAVGMNKIKPMVAGSIWLGSALIPAFFEPKSLVFSFLLIIAGGLMLLRKPATVAS